MLKAYNQGGYMPDNREERDKQMIEGIAVADLRDRLSSVPLWSLHITEFDGHNIEAAGREEVNQMLQEGWTLLHIYTLKYRENGTWRERPMAILGR
jgi:hypothetical protein